MKIKIFGGMKHYVGEKNKINIEIEGKKKVKEIAEQIGIPEDAIYLAIKDGRSLEKDDYVTNEDNITFMPVIVGG
ncbi:MAG: MoaD/ThiS family protein [Candidatus Mcinerneyibacterium aminivorans]|jgi:sulfur carrier protein ThiS|uniref:MoaD/ThiS family protein n=1 Tax=Candidatus Mcinerneyibacterium aminivorans TaxID=2703815 RepID=A0A5D0MEF4_9BACT|nr:MAG: MoaD/ThiS family protein [Candidatus Mcinerneyibacterium aminivorans]